MFAIEIEYSVFLKSANIIVITGKKHGDLTTNILVDDKDTKKRYVVKSVVFMDYRHSNDSKDTITINLEPKDIIAEDLIGKRLISFAE